MTKIIVSTKSCDAEEKKKQTSPPARRGCTLPLWLVFILQSLVVIVSFIAVILVLSLQQEVQYKDSVFREIELQLQRTSTSLTGPILERERVHTQLARRLELDTSMRYQIGDTIYTPNIQRFFNLSFFMMYEDPLAFSVFQHRLHPTLRLPASSPNGPLMYGVAGFTKELHLGVSTFNGSLTVAPNPSFPLQYTSTINVPLEMSDEDWSGSVRSVLSPQWLGVGIVYNPITDVTEMVSALAHPLELDATLGVASLSIAYAIDVRYLVGLTERAILTPTTKGILVHRHLEEVIASVNTGAALFNPTLQIAWSLSDFPDKELITGFNETDALCSYRDNCTSYAQQKGDHIISLVFITTRYGYTMSFYQVTPRDHYFAVGERAIAIGIIIGVVAATLVLVSCVVIWFAVRRPVRQLRECMQLAAQMRNDEVQDTSSLLTELDQLSLSFIQMNDKLLQARAFMPQALLLGTNVCDDDKESFHSEDDNDEIESDDDEIFVAEQDRGILISMPGEEGGEERPSSDLLTPKASQVVGERRSSFAQHHSALDQLGEDEISSSAHPPNECTHSLGTTTTIVRRKSLRMHDDLGLISVLRNNNNAPNTSTHSLIQRKVAVLVVNARGTHTLANSGGSAVLEKEQVRLVELIERCGRFEKGVVDSFHGDHFVLTFNAVRAVGAPGRSATIVGLSIRDGARCDGLALGRFSMGLSVGRALVGNVGSATMKRTCTVGAVYPNSFGLERLAKRLGHSCVVNGNGGALGEVSTVSHCLALGTVSFSGAAETDALWAIMCSNEVPGGNANEWLYEMADASETNPFNIYNNAVLAATSGKIQEALATLTEIPPPPAVPSDLRRRKSSTTVVNRSWSSMIENSSFSVCARNRVVEMASSLRADLHSLSESGDDSRVVSGVCPPILRFEV